jgi:hypothetical protein
MSEVTTYGVSGRACMLISGAVMAVGGGIAWGPGGALFTWGLWGMLFLICEHMRQCQK